MEGFGALVERVVAAIPVPRAVTRAEYAAITCNRCGVCCEDIRAPFGPEEVAARTEDPAWGLDYRRFLGFLQVVGPAPGGWRYRCRNFVRDADGRGVCTIHATRPEVCRGFPYGRVVRSWPQCSWYVTIRDADAPANETASLPIHNLGGSQ